MRGANSSASAGDLNRTDFTVACLQKAFYRASGSVQTLPAVLQVHVIQHGAFWRAHAANLSKGTRETEAILVL